MEVAVGDNSDPETTAGNSIDEEFRTPLYEGARISLGISLMLLMSFAIKHSLTDSAVRDLLQVLNLHCPAPNVCITSLCFLRSIFQDSDFHPEGTTTVLYAKQQLVNLNECVPTACVAELLYQVPVGHTLT